MFTSGVRKRRKLIVFLVTFILIYTWATGFFARLLQLDYGTQFNYPYDGDVATLVRQLRTKVVPDVAPINSYNFHFDHNATSACSTNPRLVFIIKSTPDHFRRRLAIRRTWGAKTSDVQTVFLLGRRLDANLQTLINNEQNKFQDLVQANFTDTYFNNTYKTMMGFTWVMRFCNNSQFYMFVDDDYYVNATNVFRAISNFTSKDRLYLGRVFSVSPIRLFWSKWYIDLNEYPYDKWPPYINAGAYVLSNEALIEMYYTSFYTKHFRFDDIYLALLALKSGIRPFDCQWFYNNREYIGKGDFHKVAAAHGYDDPGELLRMWKLQ